MNRLPVIDTIREFQTPNFQVIVDALPDDDLDLSWDEDGSTLAGLESGELIAFIARARVLLNGREIANDYLGGCIYKSLADFMDHKECGRYNRELAAKGEPGRCGSYFKDMINQVCDEARTELKKLCQVRVRK